MSFRDCQENKNTKAKGKNQKAAKKKFIDHFVFVCHRIRWVKQQASKCKKKFYKIKIK
jgi:hypothetical protein